MLKMILATDIIGGIGLDGHIPWSIPEDLKYFKEKTTGCNVIMGRKTYESLKRPNGLPNRFNIVLTTKEPDITNDVVYMEHDDLVEMLSRKSSLLQRTDTWFIGGGYVYEEFIDYVEEIHLTVVPWICPCDTYMTDQFSDKLTENFAISNVEPLCTVEGEEINVYIWKRKG